MRFFVVRVPSDPAENSSGYKAVVLLPFSGRERRSRSARANPHRAASGSSFAKRLSRADATFRADRSQLRGHVTYDVVVVGLGAMGSAVLDNAARRGLRVLGVEQYAPVHERGSFFGKSRMIRKAYFEQPAYVPLLLRAYEMWADLERRSGEALLCRTGVLQVGLERSPVVRGVLESARLHGLDVLFMDAAELRRRYPMTRPRHDEVAVFERDGGVLASELAVRVLQQLAIAAGAQARFGVRVTRWSRARDAARGLEIALDDGSVVYARRLALCNGPWLAGFTDRLPVPIAVQRKVQVWFEPDSEAFAAAHFPAFLVDRAGGETLYGFSGFRRRGQSRIPLGRRARAGRADRSRGVARGHRADRSGPANMDAGRGSARPAGGGLPVRYDAGRALHHRRASARFCGHRRRRLLGTRLQVRSRHRRTRFRSRSRRRHALRDRLPRAESRGWFARGRKPDRGVGTLGASDPS